MQNGMITGWPHLVQATGVSGAESPGIQLLVLQLPQTARRKGLRDGVVSDTQGTYQKRAGRQVRTLRADFCIKLFDKRANMVLTVPDE
jgi:hypothetical protein